MLEEVHVVGILFIGFLIIFSLFVTIYLIQRIKYVEKISRSITAIQPYLLLVFLAIFLTSVTYFTFHYSDDFLPFSPVEPIDQVVPLFNTTVLLTSITFFITQILLFYFAFRYRKKPGGKAKYVKNMIKLEISWIVVPALAFLFLFVWGQKLWAKMMDPIEENELAIDVMGEQFSWRARYGGADGLLGDWNFSYIDEYNDMGIDFKDPNSHDDFLPVQMHIPKGREVRIFLRSRDVIHSFYIPHLRVKMDALPGMVTSVSFTPTMTTDEMREKLNDPNFDYEIACAELCGRMHFAMKMILVVDEPEEYEEWVRGQKPWIEEHPDYKLFL